ncbi:hypothetical protein [Paracoccus sp. (in: a-proteobacteria)]|uniref:hypothetical protein n=1 Tax=Paracoccus sp. TaxID=267 RepID=UPI0032201EBA
MRRSAALTLCLALAATGPGVAQDYQPPPADSPPAEGFGGVIEDFMRNLLDQAQPHLDQLGRDLGGVFGSVAPALEDVARLMDDIANYQAPERLENGDILIRRRPDAPPPPPLGENLRDMLRPPPEDTPPNLPPRDPAREIEL